MQTPQDGTSNTRGVLHLSFFVPHQPSSFSELGVEGQQRGLLGKNCKLDVREGVAGNTGPTNIFPTSQWNCSYIPPEKKKNLCLTMDCESENRLTPHSPRTGLVFQEHLFPLKFAQRCATAPHKHSPESSCDLVSIELSKDPAEQAPPSHFTHWGAVRGAVSFQGHNHFVLPWV